MGLVDYASDSSSDSEARDNKAGPSKRRKLLPSVPSNYVVDPGDDPALHQGRTRSRPYVPGELNAHIYLSLKASRSLRNTITQLIDHTQLQLKDHTVHSLLETPTPSQKAGELHVSITHPLPLRRHQVESLRVDLTAALKRWSRSRRSSEFRCSLAAAPTVYYNGKATGGEGSGGRTFLALRVGAGSSELNSIVDKVVHPILEKYHLPLYHSNPEYHASFAWCLLEPSRSDLETTNTRDADADLQDGADTRSTATVGVGDKVPFSNDLVDELGRLYGKEVLAKQPTGGWEISSVVLRAGKALHEIPLA